MSTNRTTNRCPSTFRDARTAACGALAAILPLFVFGCQGPGPGAEFRESLKHYTLEQNYDIALHSENADARRRAVVRIAQSSHVTDPDAFRVLDVAARTDANSQVRCAAILAFKSYWDNRPVSTLLAILNPKGHTGEATPASTPVRWDATQALSRFCEHAFVPNDRLSETLDVLVAALLNDASRDVKMSAARGLGAIADKRALRALIASLRHKDFGIAYEAQNSLFRLTGRNFGYDADAWEAWLTSASDPFDRTAHAATPSATTQPAG